MEQREWLNEYMSLKQVNPANPFTVPAGYFDELEDLILSLKKLEEFKGEGFLVPENYFEVLSSNIQSRIAIEAAADSAALGFAVPEGYFEELSSNIQARVAIEELAGNDDLGFTVPDGYFNNLEQQIQSRIFVEEALTNTEEQFAVPAGYFDKLTSSILDKTVNPQPEEAKVVTMKPVPAVTDKEVRRGVIRKMIASTAFKYASAACFALVIGGGILLNSLSNPADAHKNSPLHKELSTVSTDDIRNYLQLNEDAGDTQQAEVSEGTAVDDAKLKSDLKNLLDSVQ